MRVRGAGWAGAVVLAVMLAACGEGTGPGASMFVSVGAGDGFSCGLMRDGRAWCWGQGIFGQLGNAANAPSPFPVEVVGGHRFTSLAVGDKHACGIDGAGVSWCWGLNDFAELGKVTSFCNDTFRFIFCANAPVRVGGTASYASLVAAGYATCGLTAAQTAFCWGWSTHGQLGVDSVQMVIDAPLAVVGGRTFSQLSLDQQHACGVASGGALYCWGSNQYGQLGVASADLCTPPPPGITVGCSARPIAVASAAAFASVSAGRTHSCALSADGAAFCWGSNEYGVLGTERNDVAFAEVVAVGGFHAFAQISAGEDHTCGLVADGGVLCWGMDTFGQLGGSNAGPETCPALGVAAPCNRAPTAVAAGGVRFTHVSAGTSHTCALSEGGEAWCWGRGTDGQLGDGSITSSRAPVLVRRAP